MALSNKKLKYIRRNADRMSAPEIARGLNLPLGEVEKTLVAMGHHISAPKRSWMDLAVFVSFILIIVLAPLPVFHSLYDSSSLPKGAVLRMGALLVLCGWTFAGLRKQSLGMLRSSAFFPAAGFLVWALLSLLWATERFNGFGLWTTWASCALVFFLGVQLMENRRRVLVALAAIGVAGGLVAALGVLQYLFEVDWVRQQVAPASTYNNKNMAAQVVVLSIPAAVALFLASRRKWSAICWALVLSLYCTYLFYTNTKAAWVAMAAQLLVLGASLGHRYFVRKPGWTLPKTKLRAALAAGLLTLVMVNYTPLGWQWKVGEAAATMSGVYRALGSQRERPAGPVIDVSERLQRRSESTANVRLTAWRNTLEIIREHPVAGVGLGNFEVFYPAATLRGERDSRITVTQGFERAHNDYLQVLCEIGIIGFLPLLLLIWALGRAALRLAESSSVDAAIGISWLLTFAGLGVIAGFSFPFQLPIPPFLISVYSAAVVARAGSAAPRSGAAALGGRWKIRNRIVLWTSAVAASALFAVAARVEYRWILADWSFNKQRTYLESNSEAVIAWGERVRHNNPHRKDALKYIGRAQLSGGMLEAARDTLQQVIGYYPHSPGYHYFLALANFRLKKIEEAETHLRYAIAILPHEGRLHNLLGRIENATGNPAQALKHHRLACDLDPRNGLYHYNLGVEAYRQGLFQEAADAFQSCAMLEDDNDNAHKWLGLTLIENLNRPEAGIVHLRRALALNPRIGGAARLRGLISRFDNQD